MSLSLVPSQAKRMLVPALPASHSAGKDTDRTHMHEDALETLRASQRHSGIGRTSQVTDRFPPGVGSQLVVRA